MVLTDAEELCAFARFCDPKGWVWNLARQTDDPEAQQLVKHEAGHCPAGRLVAWYRESGKALRARVRTLHWINRRYGEAGERTDLGAGRYSGSCSRWDNL